MNIHTSGFFSTLVFFAVLTLSPTPVHAVKGVLESSVLYVLVESDSLPPPATTGLYYGGCMAYLAKPISTAKPSLNCPSNWVSFSCDGTYAPKDAAYLMYDQAQLAWATKRPVSVVIDDTKKHNGYCFASRLDLK